MESLPALIGFPLAVALLLLLFLWLRRLSAAAVAEVEATLGRDAVTLLDPRARSFGLASAGWKGIRGSGCLAATADTLLFRHWVPARVVRIPRARITAVDRVRSHNGKATIQPLVRVTFTTDDGTTDALAWQVVDADRWMAELGGR